MYARESLSGLKRNKQLKIIIATLTRSVMKFHIHTDGDDDHRAVRRTAFMGFHPSW